MSKKSRLFDLKITSIECPFCANKRKVSQLDFSTYQMDCYRDDITIIFQLRRLIRKDDGLSRWKKWIVEEMSRK